MSAPATAAGCTSKCYTVTITDKVPVLLTKVLGFSGNTTIASASGTGTVSATSMQGASVATSANAYSYCIVALASSGTQGITSNGAPKANLNGCNIVSNTSATCNGHNLNAAIGNAHGTNNGCGVTQNSNDSIATDIYSGLASSIPTDTCGGSYPQEPSKKKDPALPYAINGPEITALMDIRWSAAIRSSRATQPHPQQSQPAQFW